MKGIASFVALAATILATADLGAAVAEGITINYSTTGSATYADGTPILEGERFVLVFLEPGATIDLAKDISGDVNSFLGENWTWVSYQEAAGGCCDRDTWSVPGKYGLFPKGSVKLYLLDTRIAADKLAPMAKNREGYLFPSVVNAVAPVEGAEYSWTAYDRVAHTISGPAPVQAAWVSAVKPKPVISTFSHSGGISCVSATNTVATASYVLKRASDIKFMNVLWTSGAVSGAADANAPISFQDDAATDSAAFYRVEAVAQ